MTAPIEIRYAGVPLGQPSPAREWDREGFFIANPDPLPVGTTVDVCLHGKTVRGRVLRVLESSDRGACGMRIGLLEQTASDFFAAEGRADTNGVPVVASGDESVSTSVATTIDDASRSGNADAGEENTPSPTTSGGGRGERRKKKRK